MDNADVTVSYTDRLRRHQCVRPVLGYQIGYLRWHEGLRAMEARARLRFIDRSTGGRGPGSERQRARRVPDAGAKAGIRRTLADKLKMGLTCEVDVRAGMTSQFPS
jgi:hypothetical protein